MLLAKYEIQALFRVIFPYSASISRNMAAVKDTFLQVFETNLICIKQLNLFQ